MSRFSDSSIISGSTSGHLARCTDSGADVSTERTRFWYNSSARNGMDGASSFATVTRAVYKVEYAACLSESDSDFQKRRRERRKYHVESFSTKASIGRVAFVTS